ncbi:hypothetical protein GB864_18060, partial [Agromyces sp. MMS17-SY077]|nr:hypothetical protein [Agromyces seonyuensis]
GLARLGRAGARPDAAIASPGSAARADDGAPEDGGLRTLGLQFEPRRKLVRRPGQWQGPRDEPAQRAVHVDRIGLRPMVRSDRGAWVKDGLTWQNIAFQASAARIDPAQSRWFGQFAALKSAGPAIGGYGSEWLTLEEFDSPLLWAMLAEAQRLGIALVGGDAVPRVQLSARVEVGFDVRATGPALTAAEPGAAAGAGDALQPHP